MSNTRPDTPQQPRSLREFARLVGMSPATVSRVMSGKGSVAPETANRVQELANRLGFHPSAIGQVAFGGSTSSVGVLTPTLAYTFFNDIAEGLQEYLLERDYLPVVLQRPVYADKYEGRAIRRLLAHRVDAMVLHLTEERIAPDDLDLMLKSKIPLVLLGSVLSHLDADTVNSDDTNGARQVARHLLDLGHRRIGFGYFGEGHSSADPRLDAFRQTLNDAGVVLREDDIVRLHPRAADRDDRFLAGMRELLARPDRPTAFFAGMDPLAWPTYRAARELGLSIPGDLSIVGYGDLEMSRLVDPPLTTVNQHGQEVGRLAAELVLRRLADPSASRQHLLAPARLIVRDSTASV